MNRVKLGIWILLGSMILFIWNAISWTILPWHGNTLNTIPEGTISFDEIQKVEGDGVYHYPGLPTSGSNEELKEIQKKLGDGQRVTLMVYRSDPTSLFEPMKYANSLILNIVISTLIVWVLAITRTNSQQTFRVCLASGILIALSSDIGQMIWYQFPLDYTLVSATDKVVSFGLLGFFFKAIKMDFSG